MKKYELLTDSALVEKFNDGDPAAFKEIYERYWMFVYRHALGMLKDDMQASDITQDIFLAIYNKTSTINPERPLRGYLYACAKNKVLNAIRFEKTKDAYLKSFTEFLYGSYPADSLVLERELHAQIEAELACLPPKMRAVYDLSREEEYSYKEISEVTGTAVGTVRKQIHLALKILRSKLTVILIIFHFLEK